VSERGPVDRGSGVWESTTRSSHVLRHGFSRLRLRDLLVLDRSHTMTGVLGRVGTWRLIPS